MHLLWRSDWPIEFSTMSQALLFFSLLLISIGPSIQQLESQKDPQFVSLGGTITLSCTFSAGDISDGHYPLWVQKKPNSRAQTVIYYTSLESQMILTQPSSMSASPGLAFSIPCRMNSGYTIDQLSVQQLKNLKDPESVAPGETVVLSCSYSAGTISDNNYPLWIQQKSEEVPRLLIYTTGTRASGTPARFSASKSANTMSLIITESQVEDDATYYCVVWSGSGWHICSLGWETEIKTSQQELS
ncbi:hypothetical protein Chor_011655 [Crotalus horridus]